MTKNVLIVEDNPLLAESYVSIVEDMLGYETVTASSTSEAFSLLGAPIHLALLDVEVADGVTYPLAAHILERDIPVVFVSGSDPAKVPDQLARVPFLRKPILPSALLAAARPYL
jgi:CheY-like chemotaxis protein